MTNIMIIATRQAGHLHLYAYFSIGVVGVWFSSYSLVNRIMGFATIRTHAKLTNIN